MMENKTLIQFFDWYTPADGQHWTRFQNAVPELLSLGITAAWLPPAYKGTRGPFSEGYDVYDIYDLGEFDQKGSVRTKYGTRQQYQQAMQSARQQGLQVYADIVLNHMGGAEETERFIARKVDPDNRLQFTSEPMEIESYTRFCFPGRNGKYSNFTWDYHCFTGVDCAVGCEEKAIYSIVNEYGDGWEPLVHNEKGNFDYLILNDIETRNQAVREELKRWINWFYEMASFDGLRLDAVKHINPSFFIEWIDHARATIDPDLFVLGEYWLSDDLPVLLKYLDAVGDRMSLFDAPFHHNLSVASNEKENFDLRTILTETLVGVKPELAVTFVDNHDTQPLQALEEFTEQWFKPHAYALILLREKGYPCVFHPDLYGSCYTGKNKKAEHCEIDIPALAELPVLLKARKELAYGNQQDYFDDANCIGWTRGGIDERPGSGLAVLLSNSAKQSPGKTMNLGTDFTGQSFINLLEPGAEPVRIDANGNGLFTVAPMKVGVWCLEGMQQLVQ